MIQHCDDVKREVVEYLEEQYDTIEKGINQAIDIHKQRLEYSNISYDFPNNTRETVRQEIIKRCKDRGWSVKAHYDHQSGHSITLYSV